MTPAERDRYTRVPIPLNSVITGEASNNNQLDDDENARFNHYITQGMLRVQQDAVNDSAHMRNNALAKKEQLLAKELNRIGSKTGNVDTAVQIVTRYCKEIPRLDEMVKKYHKHTRPWYRKDRDNLEFIEDTEMIHPVHKTFHMYDMLRSTKKADRSDSEEYKELMWSGLGHIFLQKLARCVNHETLMKIAIMDYCARRVKDDPLNPWEIMEQMVHLSNGLDSFISVVSPIVKKYIIYTLLFGKEWVPTVKLDRPQNINFVDQRGMLTHAMAELKDFCIIYNRAKDVYVYIHSKNMDDDVVVELPSDLNIMSTVDHLYYDEQRLDYIFKRWFSNMSRPRRLVVQSVNAKEMRDRLEVLREAEEHQQQMQNPCFTGDYEDNREMRLGGKSTITSDISWLKDTDYQRWRIEQAKNKTDETLKKRLNIAQDEYVQKVQEKEKADYDEQLERFKLARNIQAQLEDLNRRARNKQTMDVYRMEGIRLKNDILQRKMEYAAKLKELKLQHQDIARNEKDTALLKKKQGELDLKIHQLTTEATVAETKLRHQEWKVDERKVEALNTLRTTTFEDLQKYNKVSTQELNAAYDRYNERKSQEKLEKVRNQLKIVKEGKGLLDYTQKRGTTHESSQTEQMDSDSKSQTDGSGIDKELTALQLANQLKDLNIITLGKAHRDFTKTVEKETESNKEYYTQLARLTEACKTLEDENKLLRIDKKLDKHEQKLKWKNEAEKTKMLEEANKHIRQEREECSKWLSDLYQETIDKLKLQLTYMTQDLSKAFKDSLNEEHNTEADMWLKRDEKMKKYQDRMQEAQMKYDKIEQLGASSSNTIPLKQSLLLKHKMGDINTSRQMLFDENRNFREQTKNYQHLLAQQTKQARTRLDQSVRDLFKLTKEEDHLNVQKMKAKTREDMEAIDKFKKKAKEHIGNMQSLEDVLANPENGDEEDIADRASFLSEEMIAKLYEKIDSAMDKITELPEMYAEYTDIIRNSGIDLNNDNPYEMIDKKTKSILDVSQAKYVRVVTEMYEHVQKLYESISKRINVLYRTMDCRLGVEEQDEDTRGLNEILDDDGCPPIPRINANLADRTHQEEKVVDIIGQADHICNSLTTECTNVQKQNEDMIAKLHTLQNRLHISEAKNNTSAKTMKMQHMLIQDKHKEIARAIEQFQSFFKSKMQELLKITEKSIRENQKKVKQMKKGMARLKDEHDKVDKIAEYTQQVQLTPNQQDTVKDLVLACEREKERAQAGFDNAYKAESSHLESSLEKSRRKTHECESIYDDLKRNFVKTSEDFVDKLIKDIDSDVTRGEIENELDRAIQQHRTDQVKSQFAGNALNVDQLIKEDNERMMHRQLEMTLAKQKQEDMLRQFQNTVDKAAIQILTLKEAITEEQKRKLLEPMETLKKDLVQEPAYSNEINPILEHYPSQTIKISEFPGTQKTTITTTFSGGDTATFAPPGGSDTTAFPGGSDSTFAVPLGGTTYNTTAAYNATVNNTSIPMASRHYQTPTPNNSSADFGGDGSIGDGNKGGDSNGGTKVLDVPNTGQYKKKGGNLLVITDKSGAALIREGNDRIETAQRIIQAKDKELNKRENQLNDLHTRIKLLQEEIKENEDNPQNALQITKEGLNKHLEDHQRQLFQKMKLDLIRKLDSESHLIGADKSVIRRDFIEKQRQIIEEQMQQLQEDKRQHTEHSKKQLEEIGTLRKLQDGQRNPDLPADLEHIYHNDPVAYTDGFMANRIDQIESERKEQLKALKELDAPPTMAQMLSKITDNWISDDKNWIPDDQIKEIKGMFEEHLGVQKKKAEETPASLSSIIKDRAKQFNDIIEDIRDQDIKTVQKHYNDRIKRYIDNVQKKNRYEALCKVDKDKESDKSNQARIMHMPFVDEDIIFLERSTLAHDDNVPQLNDTNIEVFYKHLRRNWELMTTDTFQSSIDININGVKTGESVDIIYILKHPIRKFMSQLTDNNIDFKVIISSSDIALKEYELFYEFQLKKSSMYSIKNVASPPESDAKQTDDVKRQRPNRKRKLSDKNDNINL